MTDFFKEVPDLGSAAPVVRVTPRQSRAVTLRAHLLSPLVHGAFGAPVGNATLIRRYAISSLPGMPRVPAVSGNALRGVLRREVFGDLFARADLGPGHLPGSQWDRLYAALANGGHLEGSESTYRPEAVAELRAAIPPLSVFGGALYSWMLPGRMSVGILWPRCQETVAAKILKDVPGERPAPAEDLVEEVSHVRHVDRAMQDPEVSGVTPMPTTMETLVTGTVLESSIRFSPHATAVERGAVLYGCLRLVTVGGKSGSGLSSIRVEVVGEHEEDVEAYRAWLDSLPIRDLLTNLAEALETKKGKKGKSVS